MMAPAGRSSSAGLPGEGSFGPPKSLLRDLPIIFGGMALFYSPYFARYEPLLDRAQYRRRRFS